MKISGLRKTEGYYTLYKMDHHTKRSVRHALHCNYFQEKVYHL